MDKVGLLFFPAFDWSLGEQHPEREERLLYTRDQIFEEGIMDLAQFREYSPYLADRKHIARTHAVLPHYGEFVTPAHRIAVGGTLTLADALLAGEIERGFALIRPPGHHAMHTVYGNRGFCTVNNVAVLVNYLRRTYGVRRIAIVDTDVHHGDGTQDIFYHDPDILFISIHQDGRTLYPGTGFPQEQGGPQAFGTTLNVPLPPGTGDDGLLYVLEELVMPLLEEFKPELVINSAGQDNHYTDPLASMKITARGYGELTKILQPDLAVLEGGYAIETALPYVNLSILLALAGLDFSNVEVRQKPHATVSLNQIKSLVSSLKHRKQPKVSSEAWYSQERTVFYDTDYIWEAKVEMIRGCKKCAGLHLTRSGSDAFPGPTPSHLVIHQPFCVCEHCKAEAHRILSASKGKYQAIYWLDQALDQFYYYTGRNNEIVQEIKE